MVQHPAWPLCARVQVTLLDSLRNANTPDELASVRERADTQ